MSITVPADRSIRTESRQIRPEQGVFARANVATPATAPERVSARPHEQNLLPRQRAILAEFRRRAALGLPAPTVREAGRAAGITTNSVTHYHLEVLGRLGHLVDRGAGTNRRWILRWSLRWAHVREGRLGLPNEPMPDLIVATRIEPGRLVWIYDDAAVADWEADDGA